MPVKKIRSYTVHDSSYVVEDEILWIEAVWKGSYRKPKFAGTRRIAGKILRESYGAAKQQHTFSIRVVGSDGIDPIKKGTTIRRKGRNIYSTEHGLPARQPRDEVVREEIVAEKHSRGDEARAERAARIAQREIDRYLA